MQKATGDRRQRACVSIAQARPGWLAGEGSAGGGGWWAVGSIPASNVAVVSSRPAPRVVVTAAGASKRSTCACTNTLDRGCSLGKRRVGDGRRDLRQARGQVARAQLLRPRCGARHNSLYTVHCTALMACSAALPRGPMRLAARRKKK